MAVFTNSLQGKAIEAAYPEQSSSKSAQVNKPQPADLPDFARVVRDTIDNVGQCDAGDHNVGEYLLKSPTVRLHYESMVLI